MDNFLVDYRRLKDISTEVTTLTSRLKLADDVHYFRHTMRVEMSGSQLLMDSCGHFENEWAFGRDRIEVKLTSFAEFLSMAADTFATADANLAGEPTNEPES